MLPGVAAVSGQVFSMMARGITVAREARTWRGRKRLLLASPLPSLPGEGSFALFTCVVVVLRCQLLEIKPNLSDKGCDVGVYA